MIIHFSVEFQFFGIPGDIFLFQSVSPPDISSRRQVLTHKKNLGKIQRPVFPEIITDTAFTGDTAMPRAIHFNTISIFTEDSFIRCRHMQEIMVSDLIVSCLSSIIERGIERKPPVYPSTDMKSPFGSLITSGCNFDSSGEFILIPFGDDVHHSTHRIRTIHGGERAFQYFHLLYIA